jgi:hypothetical protein
MMSDPNPHARPIADAMIRDPLASRDAVLEARRHSMAERLELALSWNTVASELRAGLAEVKGRAQRR